ncbi:MAG: hypothetical protein ABIK89_00155 [Planctomycetota bacterium]
MWTLFLICAVIGGTVLFFQLALLLIGFGGEALDMDVPDDLDVDLDVDVDVDVADDIGEVDHAHTVAAFKVLSFRTIIAALTFFGLGGMTAQAAEFPTLWVLVVAVASGGAAMYAVYWLFQGIQKLQADGTVRVAGAVGKAGTVYTPIPGNGSGTGKIQLNLQNRTMEYLAMTSGDRLVTGAKVVVTGVITSDTLEVEPVPETEE